MVVFARQPSLLAGALIAVCTQPLFATPSELPRHAGNELASKIIIVDNFDASEEGSKARKKAVTALLAELKSTYHETEAEAEQTELEAAKDNTGHLDLYEDLELSDAGNYHEVAVALLDGLKPSPRALCFNK